MKFGNSLQRKNKFEISMKYFKSVDASSAGAVGIGRSSSNGADGIGRSSSDGADGLAIYIKF